MVSVQWVVGGGEGAVGGEGEGGECAVGGG